MKLSSSTGLLLALTSSGLITLAQADSSHPRPRHAPRAPKTEAFSLRRRQPISTSAADLDGMTFDFVVAGGGLAGLAIAARLSEYSNFTVAVIEAGTSGESGTENDFSVPDLIDIPGNSYLHGLTYTDYDWGYKTVVQEDAGGTTKYWPRGKVLGGSGAINGLFWCRGSSAEYDAWDDLNPGGAESWGWSEMNKYIMKAENFTPPTTEQISSSDGYAYDLDSHGTSGPIQVGYSSYWFSGNTKWIPAWVSMGFKSIDGASGTNHGASITPSTLNPTNQTRCDSKAGYIDPMAPRSNLVILTGYQVTGVTWNSTNSTLGAVASGVTFQASSSSTAYHVNASKEVILSGGTIGSAQILQLSGVGPSALLKSLDIDVVSDLPVGYNLQDHQSNSMYWTTPSNTTTWGTLRDNTTLAAAELVKYKDGDYGSMWTYVNEAIGYVSLADVMSDYKAFAQNATANLTTNVDALVTTMGLNDAQKAGLEAMYNITNNYLTSDVGQFEILLTELSPGITEGMGIQAAFQHPYTRGTVLINTTNAFAPPIIDPRYYSHNYDVEITRAGHTWVRTLAAATPLNELMITETSPGASVTGTELDAWFRKGVATEYHILGTASMLPKEYGGVVDTTLTVYGTTNLRVVDSSIMPLQVSAHLMAPTYGVAEKAADIIKKKYQLVETVASSSSSATASSTSDSTTSASSASASSASASSTASSSVEAGDVNAHTGSSDLSTGVKGGIGAAVGVAALAAVIAAIILARRRSRRNATGDEKGWYASPEENDAWSTPVPLNDRSMNSSPAAGAFYNNDGNHSNAMLNHSQSYHNMAPALFATTHRDSFNTLDMAAAEPMGNHDNYYARAGPSTPYNDEPDPMSRR